MTKYALLFGAALLTACSSEPSDYRPNDKVSVDAVAAGTRTTGLYPAADRADAAPAEGHGTAHGEGHMQGEIHNADASESAATGAEVQKSAVGESATEEKAPASAADTEHAQEAAAPEEKPTTE